MFACTSPHKLLYLLPFSRKCLIGTEHVQLLTEMRREGDGLLLTSTVIVFFYHLPDQARCASPRWRFTLQSLLLSPDKSQIIGSQLDP